MDFHGIIILMFAMILFVNAVTAWAIFSMISKALDLFLDITRNNRLCMTSTLYAAQQTKANPPKKD